MRESDLKRVKQAKDALNQQDYKTIRANREKALAWLGELAKVSPLGRWVLKCLLCDEDSLGLIRCKKHEGRYSGVFYRDTASFLESFKGQM